MRVISDIHIHSKYSRACSKDLIPQNLDKWAKIKGVDLIGTGDFTHPLWLGELRSSLQEAEPGFYQLKGSTTGTRFVLSSEVACIYSQGERLRRVHYVLLLPSFAAVEKFNKTLADHGGKLAGDGRPILGMKSQEVLKYLLDASPQALMIPAHAWTPYFGIFGSKSGFDSVEECFGDMTKYIYAFETGLSSDPEMNWRFSGTDKFTIVSASDAHSLPRIGREANVMEIPEAEMNYAEFFRIIKEKDTERFKFTIEYFPEEGKYHLDGHATCKVCMTPEQTRKHHGECPVCGRKLVIGVVSRVEDLADRPAGFVPAKVPGQRHLVPLEEVLADCFGVGAKSKKVQDLYWRLIAAAGNEFAVILDLPVGEVERIGGLVVAEAVKRVRDEAVHKVPGYDGVYGIIKVFTDGERQKFERDIVKQKTLF
jgi:uncharacterized protein (TIGR00375 family)